MKLNHDCIRDCLLYLESVNNLTADADEELSFDPIFIEDIYAALKEWSKEDVLYTIFNLDQGGYINASMEFANDSFVNVCVNYITFQGHEFLDSIRDDKRWKVVKRGLRAVRDYSLSAITAIAQGATAGIVPMLITNGLLSDGGSGQQLPKNIS